MRATGAHSEMGKIGKDLRTIETEQPHLQRQMSWLIRDFAIVGAVAGALVVLLFGLLRGSWLQAMLGGIALGMSLLPEEFPLVMTVFMAMGAWRISQARVLTRRASAIETLGCNHRSVHGQDGNAHGKSDDRRDLERRRRALGQGFRGAAVASDERRTGGALLASAKEPSDPMDLAVHAMAGARRFGTGGCDAIASSFVRTVFARIYSRLPMSSAMRRSGALVRTPKALWKRSANSAACHPIGWLGFAAKWMNWPTGESGCSRSPIIRI